jgi:hypothetical protein
MHLNWLAVRITLPASAPPNGRDSSPPSDLPDTDSTPERVSHYAEVSITLRSFSVFGGDFFSLAEKGSENVMFLRDAVRPSERFMAAKRKAHLWQGTTSNRRRSPRISGRIHLHDPTLPRPCHLNLRSGAHPQRPGQPGLRPDLGGNSVHVANRPAPHAHPGARNLFPRVWHVAPLRCPVCQNPMRVIAVING